MGLLVFVEIAVCVGCALVAAARAHQQVEEAKKQWGIGLTIPKKEE